MEHAMSPHRLLAALLLLGGLLAIPPSARAAESYDGCANRYITSLPATIGTQGTWCLGGNLSTNIATGNAITIAANNVTIDCNGFKIGGLAAGNGSRASGIHSDGKQNVTVRNCNIRGFFQGIFLDSGAGHLVEDNRLDNNLFTAISVSGDNNRVRRNAVYDTGGAANFKAVFVISGTADFENNVVSGVFADSPGGDLYGIESIGSGAQIRGNGISGFDMTAVQGGAVGTAYGIIVMANQQRMSGNHVAGGSGNIAGIGINIESHVATAYCLDNTVIGFDTAISGGCISEDNVTY